MENETAARAASPMASGAGGLVEGMAVILAIDPGQTGAIASYDPATQAVDVRDMPGTVPDTMNLLRDMGDGRVRLCLIEKQQAMPRQGLSSTFKLARHFGHLEAFAMALGYPLDFVTPAVWKRVMGLQGKDKNASREMAQRLFPDCDDFNRVKDHGRAEAVLLAVYAKKGMGV